MLLTNTTNEPFITSFGFILTVVVILMYIKYKNGEFDDYRKRNSRHQDTSGKWNKVVLSSGSTFYKYYDSKKGIEKVVDLPYSKKDILTPIERKFWKVLKPKCDKYNILICPKVRLEDIVDIDIPDFKEKQSHRGRIKSRHIDFLLCDNNLNSLAAIELDDSTHDSNKAMKTDAFKDDVFEIIGIPLYRVRVNEFLYNMRIDDILNQIVTKMNHSGNQEPVNIFQDYKAQNNEP